MKDLYHAAQPGLFPGFIIQPGNQGNSLETYLHCCCNNEICIQNAWKMLIESQIEQSRLMHYSNKPNRSKSAYAFLSEFDAYSRKNQLGDGVNREVYVVEIVDLAQPYHVGSFDLYNDIACKSNRQPFLSKIRKYSSDYWLGKYYGVMELVTESALRIMRTI